MLSSVLVSIICYMSRCQFLRLVIDGAKGGNTGQSKSYRKLEKSHSGPTGEQVKN